MQAPVRAMRVGRLFDRASGRAFITAIDHGLVTGVQPGAEQILAAVGRLISYEPEGILVSPGTLRHTGHLFAFHGAPSPNEHEVGRVVVPRPVAAEYRGACQTTVKSLRHCAENCFYSFCSYFRSGGTRTRIGNTMISVMFSGCRQVSPILAESFI